MRASKPFEPRILTGAVKPGVKRGARAGNQVRFFISAEVFFCHMRLAHARVVNQFVFLVLPDRALDIEWRRAGNRRPAVAPVVTEESHVQMTKGEACWRERHG